MSGSLWSDSAPEYMRRGEMYCRVTYDNNGSADRIIVRQNQIHRGKFNMEGSTAVYELNNILTLPEADDEVVDYVEQLPFVQAVDMSALERDTDD